MSKSFSNRRNLILSNFHRFMAARHTHVNIGILFYVITIGILYFLDVAFDPRKDIVWFILGFLLTIYGSEFPDVDQLYKRVFNHRDWFTHSALFPLILFGMAISVETSSLYPLLAFFNIGLASHLFMDYLPTWKSDGDKKLEGEDIEYAAKWIAQGLTGKELVQKLVGTYLIHLPFRVPKEVKGNLSGRKTLTVIGTRLYLYMNGLILLCLSGLLFYLFYF